MFLQKVIDWVLLQLLGFTQGRGVQQHWSTSCLCTVWTGLLLIKAWKRVSTFFFCIVTVATFLLILFPRILPIWRQFISWVGFKMQALKPTSFSVHHALNYSLQTLNFMGFHTTIIYTVTSTQHNRTMPLKKLGQSWKLFQIPPPSPSGGMFHGPVILLWQGKMKPSLLAGSGKNQYGNIRARLIKGFSSSQGSLRSNCI